MVAKLKRPRRVMLLVKAGSAVDAFIDKLVPLLEAGDIIIDGGNSEYQDTNRRCASLEEKGILYVGSGVSGGEEGARYGPSLMPGGKPSLSYPKHFIYLRKILSRGQYPERNKRRRITESESFVNSTKNQILTILANSAYHLATIIAQAEMSNLRYNFLQDRKCVRS